MQSKALLILALIIPQTAAAFGDLDCISIEVCRDEICTPEVQVLSVSFYWPDQTATVIVGDAPFGPLALYDQYQSDDTSELRYGGDTDDSPAATITARATDISLVFSQGDPRTGYLATCTRKSAV